MSIDYQAEGAAFEERAATLKLEFDAAFADLSFSARAARQKEIDDARYQARLRRRLASGETVWSHELKSTPLAAGEAFVPPATGIPPQPSLLHPAAGVTPPSSPSPPAPPKSVDEAEAIAQRILAADCAHTTSEDDDPAVAATVARILASDVEDQDSELAQIEAAAALIAGA